MTESELEKIVLQIAGNISARYLEHGSDKFHKKGDYSWEELTSYLEELTFIRPKSHLEKIRRHLNIIALKLCLKDYDSVTSNLYGLKKLKIPPKLIKRSELYTSLAKKCVIWDFERETKNKNFGNAISIIESAERKGINLPDETYKVYEMILDQNY